MEPGRVGTVDGVDVVALLADFDRRVSTLSFNEIAKGALAFMSQRLGLSRASVALCQNDGAGFRLFDATMEVHGVESGRIIPRDSASLGLTVTEKRSVYRPDIRLWPHANAVDRAFVERGLLCTFSAPLLSGGRCLGTLNAAVPSVDGIPLTARQVIELATPRLAFALEVGLAHEALAESEARFRDIFETVGDGIIVADVSNRRLVMANTAASRMLKRPREELLSLRVNDLHPADRLEEVLKIFNAMVRGELASAIEIPLQCGDGTLCLADVSARPTSISGKSCVVGVFRDATARRQREHDALHTQKLESIRTLAAGIAHDFNNLLTGILGNISLAAMRIESTHDVAPLLAEAERATTRATALTRQLLTFSKGGAPVRKEVDLARLVHENAQYTVSGSNVRCEFDVKGDDWRIFADAAQLAQAVQNMVHNAVEAMPGGGVVSLRLEKRSGSSGDEACLSIEDSGAGIPDDLLDRIFLPFVSTKKTGNGLGLSVAYSIVRNHGGQISVTSKPGVGTTFRITLPIVLPTAPDNGQPPRDSSSTQPRVLVMDDESIVLDVAERILKRIGCDVEVACHGEEAIARYAAALSNGRRFDVVVLDLTVPGGMGGQEAAARIRALDPDARLVVSSGYSDDRVMADYHRFGFQAVLPKPYTAGQLRDIIASIQSRG